MVIASKMKVSLPVSTPMGRSSVAAVAMVDSVWATSKEDSLMAITSGISATRLRIAGV